MLVQAATPELNDKWSSRLKDEPARVPFTHGTISFAGAGVDSRNHHVFIALRPKGRNLGKADHETPLGQFQILLPTLAFFRRCAFSCVCGWD
jgi:hypothetical protein